MSHQRTPGPVTQAAMHRMSAAAERGEGMAYYAALDLHGRAASYSSRYIAALDRACRAAGWYVGPVAPRGGRGAVPPGTALYERLAVCRSAAALEV